MAILRLQAALLICLSLPLLTLAEPLIEHILVKPQAPITAARANAIPPAVTLKAAAAPLEYERPIAGGAHRLRLPYAMTAAEAQSYIAQLGQRMDLKYGEPDWPVYPAVVPNDPLYWDQWHYHEPSGHGIGINLPGAWEMTTGDPDMVIAVLDTGLVPHSDIALSFEGSGRVLPGYDFYSNDDDPTDPGDFHNGEPSSWHGTHVTGTIGALTDNDLGVTGINWQSNILPVRILRHDGNISNVINGLRWAAGLNTVEGVPLNPSPAKIVNLSIQASGSCPVSLQSAIDTLVNLGIIVVVAAGNSSKDAATVFPANCNGVITVGATDKSGYRASFSNYGSSVFISAPGVDIHSTLNSGTQGPVPSPAGDTYGKMSGTSMAAPHVTGVISLMLAVEPDLSLSEVKGILAETARPFSSNSYCATLGCGVGIIDASAAVAATMDMESWREALRRSEQQEQIVFNLMGSETSSTSGGCGRGASDFADGGLPLLFSVASLYALRRRHNV